MELTSMKMSASEQKEYTQPTMATGPEAPLYPWGLCVTLDDDALGKLGLPALPAVGQTMMLHARVEVVRVSVSENQDEKQRDMELQITAMALEADAGEKKMDAETALYGSHEA